MMRAMRLIVMFDVPSVTGKDKKNYRKWHSFLIQNGFIMMTESVYSRLLMNRSLTDSVKKLIRKNLPPKGDIQVLEVTERQFASIDYLLGKPQEKTVDSNERYVEI